MALRWWQDGNKGGWFRLWSDLMTLGAAELIWQHKDKEGQVQDAIDNYDPSSQSPYDLEGQITALSEGYGGASSDQQKYVDNLIAEYERETANQQEERMRDTSLLSSAEQLSKLGLGASGVLSVNGSNAGVSAEPARANQQSPSQAQYDSQMANTRAVMSMIKGMASAGIYGSAYAKARGIAQNMASHTASSTQPQR